MKLPPYYTIVWFKPVPHSYLREPFLGYLRKKKSIKCGYLKDVTIASVTHKSLGIELDQISDWWDLSEDEKQKGESH